MGPEARMAVVATEPLTRDELWSKATPGTLWVFRAGELLATFPGASARGSLADDAGQGVAGQGIAEQGRSC
jgi:glutamine amidotransferase